ncbi:MAG: alpha/beta hydrolase [Intrasporangium sp.]|uniref:alpha/beta fold hydrolase n=1 Tax=Intrasporangium sp. TaxID=1925024 RepID=UPI002648F433|nr:alpha/beta fold hydrolase [Intrasporangium sp.]MDN5796913.1 alpha/beta hydrolase [Intrasporangium sp.]
MKRLTGIVAAVSLIVSGLAIAPAAHAAPATFDRHRPPTEYQPPPIAWGPCTNPTLVSFGAECGMLTVPLDYARPSGEKIQLAVSRMRHTTPDSQYQGVTLVNPGGPGGSGQIYSVLQQFIPSGAGLSYDWIGFDPRGVGASVPSLTCDGNYFGYNRPYYVPITRQLQATWLTKTANYARACDAAGGRLLDHMKTTDWVADMESLRIALGQKQINYYGFSYGTYLGQVYATLHPDRVRRFVLDSNVDPRRVWYQADLDQDVAFDKNMGIYFDWVAKHDSVYHLGNDGAAVERTYYRILRQLRSRPRAGGLVGPDEWTDAFLGAGYYVFGWEDIARAFDAAVNKGDFAGIKDLYDASNGQGPGADNTYAVYLAVECTDVRWPRPWWVWQRDNWRTYVKAPFETWANAWYNAPCRSWSGGTGTPVQVDGTKVPPVLLIDETNDAATPYTGSLEVRKLFPKSILVEGVGGTTHAGSLSGVACVDDTIAVYFATGDLPTRKPGNRSDLQCDPVPQPSPSAASLRSPAPSGELSPELRALRLQLLSPVH